MKPETKSESPPQGKNFLKWHFLRSENGMDPALLKLRMCHVEHMIRKSYTPVTILMLTSGTSSAIIYLSVGNNPRRKRKNK